MVGMPWKLWLISGDLEKQIASFPTSVGGLIISKTDHLAQEDALRINRKFLLAECKDILSSFFNFSILQIDD